jgi:outer membrane protein OmpA-like peptidoglycan-associated protein
MALPSLPSILVRLEFVPYTSALAPSTLNAVQQLAAALQRDPGVMIELQGFADLARKSSLDASRDIATRRAGNVAQALVDAGVAPERLRVNGVGLDFMPGAVRDRVDVVVVR